MGAVIAALAWCALVGWFAIVRGARVPLVGWADLGFHELGHLIFYVIPAGDFVTAIAGSATQILVPLAAAGYFVARRDRLAAAVCLAWAAGNCADVGAYVADAPHERLQLIGGEHDWAYLLGPEQLDRLAWASGIASGLRLIAMVLIVIAVGAALDVATRPRGGRSRAGQAFSVNPPRG
jgi:hypothetical protein